MYPATERLRDASPTRRFVLLQNTIFVGYKGVVTTELDRAARCVKSKISNMQIAESEQLAAKVTMCNLKSYTS
jgi:hypothetical protein